MAVPIRDGPAAPWGGNADYAADIHECRELEVRTAMAASPIANFGFKAVLES
jgi:hypothetical protein